MLGENARDAATFGVAVVLALIGTAFIFPGAIRTPGNTSKPGTTTATPKRHDGQRVVIGLANRAPRYGWSLAQAVQAWNTSGARITFEYVPATKAQITVTIAAPDACDSGPRILACTGLGPLHGEHRTIWIVHPLGRYDEARVLVHELGHVLGLGHDPRGCVAMTPTLWQNCRSAPRGEWRCRLLAHADVDRAISIYGGRLREARASVFCPESRS